jgi:hypothetical protein
LQAIADSLLEALGCDSFLQALRDYGEQQKGKELLIAICGGFLEKHNAAGSKIEELSEQCQAVLRRFRQVCSAVIASLHPKPSHLGSSAVDLNAIQKYKGNGLLESAVKQIFTASTKGTTNFWQKCLDEVITKGAASISSAPELQELSTFMESVDLETVINIDMIGFQNLCSRIPALKKAMRSGLVKEAEKTFQAILLKLAGAIMASTVQDLPRSITGSSVETVVHALEGFQSTPGMLRLAQDLTKWKAKTAKTLAVSELIGYCSKCPKPQMDEDAQTADDWIASQMTANNDGARDLNLFFEYWNACAQEVKDDAQIIEKVHAAIHWHVRVIYLSYQARVIQCGGQPVVQTTFKA